MTQEMTFGVAHHRQAEESPEAKARWFQSLSLAERMDLLCDFTDLIFAQQPNIADTKDAQQTANGIRIVSTPGR